MVIRADFVKVIIETLMIFIEALIIVVPSVGFARESQEKEREQEKSEVFGQREAV